MIHLLRTYRAWRREQRLRREGIAMLHQSQRELVKVYAALRFAGISDEAREQIEGLELRCVYCGKTFVHDKHCTLGFCQQCS